MFSSNDPYCEPVSFALKTSNGAPNSATDPTTAESANFFIASNTPSVMSLYPQDENVFTFYILAQSVAGKYAYKTVEFTVICDTDSQTVSLSEAGTLFVDVLKNEGTRTLLDVATVQSLFQTSDAARCLIQTFEVFKADQSAPDAALSSLLNLAARTDAKIEFDTTVAMTDGTVNEEIHSFAIKATATGGAFTWKTVEVHTVICKWEEVTLVEAGRKLYEFHTFDPQEVIFPIEQNFTSNDTFCPPYVFSLKLDNLAPDIATSPSDESSYKLVFEGESVNQVVLTEDKLWIYHATIGEFPFYIFAQTAGAKYAYKEVMLSVSDGCDHVFQVITLTNPGTHIVEVTKNTGIIQMLSPEVIESLFTLENPNRCLFESFEILKADGTAVTSSDDLYSRFDIANRDTFAIKIDTTVAQTDGTVVTVDFDFKIKGTTNGEVSLSKDVTAKIIVCGFEELSHDSAVILDFTLEVDPAAENTLQPIVTLFSSNDSFCPPLSYAIKTSESDPTNAAANNPTDADKLNFDMSDATTLRLYPELKAEYNFFLRAVSVTGKYAYKPVKLTVVCGLNSQTISLVDSATLASFSVIKNNPNQFETFITAAQTIALFTVSDSRQCLIQSYEVVNADGSVVASDSELYSRLNLAARSTAAIELDSIYSDAGDVVDVVFAFKVKALAEGGHFVLRDMEVHLVVCSFEVVTVVDSTELFIEQYVDEPVNIDTALLPMFTTNDTDCPANRFRLKDSAWNVADGWDASTVSTADYQIFENDKLRTFPQNANEWTFQIATSTVSGKMAARSVLLDVEHVCTTTDQLITPVTTGTLELTVVKN